MEFELGSFLSVILSLLVLEILLSVDNALVNVSIARSLPPDKRASALRLGILLGAVFRVVALLLATLIINNVWLRVAGALYLVFLMFNHLGQQKEDKHTEHKRIRSYKKVIMHIAFADIVFSIDNVVSAIGLSSNIVYIISGVLIGIASILLMSKYLVKILDSYPRLANTGYVIVGFIGVVMLLEELGHWSVSSSSKFIVIVVMALFTIWYERSKTVQLISGPVLHVGQTILAFPGRVIRVIRTAVIKTN